MHVEEHPQAPAPPASLSVVMCLVGPNTSSPPQHARPGIPVPWVALAGPANSCHSLLGAKAQPVPRRGDSHPFPLVPAHAVRKAPLFVGL